MNTLQILDGGETFLLPLGDEPIEVGCAPDADLRLTEAGVAPRHAVIEPLRDGYKLVDRGSPGGTTVNGERIVQVRLRVGDRIEIGRAVLVVGRRVSRPATPEDVLRGGLESSRHSRAGDAAEARRQKIWLVAIALLSVVLGSAYWLTRADGPPAGLLEVARLRRAGKFAAAYDLLAHYRQRWAGGDLPRNEWLDTQRARVEATETAVESLRARIQREVPERAWVEQRRELDELTAAVGVADGEREAAGILRRTLRTVRESARVRERERAAEVDAALADIGARVADPDPRVASPDGGSGGRREDASVDPSVEGEGGRRPAAETEGVGRSTRPVAVAEVEPAAAARRLMAAERFHAAFELLERALAAEPEAEEADRLREAIADVRSTGGIAATEWLRGAERLRHAGDLDAAIAALEMRVADVPRRPGIVDLAEIVEAWRQEREAGWRRRVGLAAAPEYGAELNREFVAAMQGERAGDWTAAIGAWQRAAQRLAGRPLAAIARRRIEGLQARVEFAQAVATRVDHGRAAGDGAKRWA